MLTPIISQFAVPGAFLRAGRFGSGLINETYLCEFSEENSVRKYILQRINAAVFKHPDQVMQNVETVTTHMLNRLRADDVADPASVMPALVRTRDGQAFHRDAGGAYWRMFHFIETGAVHDTVQDAPHAFEVGRALGNFQSLVSDLDPELLHDTLPGFHLTSRYLAEYDEALKADPKERAAGVRVEQEFVRNHRSLASALTDLIAARSVPFRVVHNDPKVNNVMVHAATGKALCMLDLDTVKSGIAHFDFGDCIRSAVNPAGEDASDLDQVGLDLALFEAVSRGYLQEAAVFLTPKELETLPISVKVITFELGLRFLIDHLRGDTYFKVRYPGHNLHRARVQFRLLESIESRYTHIVAVMSRR